MKISPLDIRKKEFRKTMRGLDEQQVSAFLEMVAGQLEELVKENLRLTDMVATSQVQLENYRKIEEALRNALITAERVARDTKQNADQEVELILKDADLRAQRSVHSARAILEGIRADLLELAKQRRDFLARFRLLVETQLKMLDLKSIECEREEDLRRLEEFQKALFDRNAPSPEREAAAGEATREEGESPGAGPEEMAVPAGGETDAPPCTESIPGEE